MAPSFNEGQDARVAVLQVQQATLEESLRDLTRTLKDGFEAIDTKMDRLNDLDRKLSFARGVVFGGGALYGMALSLLVWISSDYVTRIKEHDHEIETLKVQIANYHPRADA